MTNNDDMKDRALHQAQREYAPSRRLAAIAAEAFFFIVMMPWLLATAGLHADRALAFPRIANGHLSLLFGSPLMLIGLFFAIWSVSRLFSLGKGTPLPFMATREIVVRAPYSYCRNPMAFGTILFYLGIALAIGSLSALALALLFAAGLLVYVRMTEETELRRRFGAKYLEYKSRTPFLIPRLW
jgi:protein-S-isoprenylcysteine O-methyltransferase Ste14